MNEWVEIISTVGFPIAMCLIVYGTMLNMVLKRLDRIEEKLDKHIGD